MEYVEPIRDKKKIDAMKKVLKADSNRNYIMFLLGINSGLRISDMLLLKVSDVKDKKGKINDRVVIREKKTNKSKNFPLSKPVQKALEEYTNGMEYGGSLLPSREGDNKSITRQQAYRIINAAARAVGITDQIGTHTLRKTFGYHAHKQGASLELLQKLFNHAAPSITMRYIGITQDDMDAVYLSMDL